MDYEVEQQICVRRLGNPDTSFMGRGIRVAQAGKPLIATCPNKTTERATAKARRSPAAAQPNVSECRRVPAP